MDLLAQVNEKGGDELEGEAVTGYDFNVPLVRGKDRTAEMAGEEVGERRGDGEKRARFLAVMLALISPKPSIYEHRIL